MTLVHDMAAFLAPRLGQLVHAQNEVRSRSDVGGRMSPEADLKLVTQLATTGTGSFSQDILHRLLFEIANRRGWTTDPEFDERWAL